MKKRSEATQTLRAGCSKADPQTNTQTKKQTHTQTDRDDYNTLRSLARSVITVYQMTGFIKEFEVVVAPP